MRRFVGVSAVAFVLALSAVAVAGAGGTRVATGLYGELSISPALPVCPVDGSCSRPLAGATLLFQRDGVVVGRARTRAGGAYRIALRPGRYTVSLQRRAVTRTVDPDAGGPGASTRIGVGLTPRRVTVSSTGFRRVDFELDVGIR